MAKSTPSSPFYWNDYYRDTRIIPPMARGIWMDMLCRLHESTTRGSVTLTVGQWSQWCSCPQEEFLAAVALIRRCGIATVTLRNGGSNGKVTVVSRRMKREEKAKLDNALRQSTYRKKQQSNGGVTERVTGKYRGSSSSSSSSSSKKNKNPPTPLREEQAGDNSEAEQILTQLSPTLQAMFRTQLTLQDQEPNREDGAAP